MKSLDEIYAGPIGYALYWFMWVVVLPISIAIGCLILYVVYRTLCDAFRFGRKHLSFPLMIGVAALFSALGYGLAGLLGVAPGLLYLAVYGFGWWRGLGHAKEVA